VSGPIDVLLIAGGPWHDMDHARLELLGLMAEQERLRVNVRDTYRAEDIAKAAMIVTYTCDLVPDDPALDALDAFFAKGGRWFALHGTNSRIVLENDHRVLCPPLPRRFLEMLGSQFAAHPAPGTFKVVPTDRSHPLTAGIDAFHVTDEQYLQHHLPGNEVLLSTRFEGPTPLFERTEWPAAEHQVMYLRAIGAGALLYLTLGHTRGRYDMRPIMEHYPFVERGAWPHPVFRELLRRGIAWAIPG
jgi:type 1 glutamine amidotransferase